MITGHGGNVKALADRLQCPIDQITDMSSNLNPLGPPPGLVEFIKENIHRICSLPDVDASKTVHAFSRYYDIDSDRVIAGNGTTWFIYTLPAALGLKKMLISGPTYSDYRDACIMHSVDYTYSMASREFLFEPDFDRVSEMLSDKSQNIDAFVLCNPNNPTGSFADQKRIIDLLTIHRDIIFIIDESYLPFMDDAESISLVGETNFPNLIVLSSMSKIFRIPGLRTGFLCADPAIVKRIMAFYQPWSVNALAQAAVIYIFENNEIITPFIEKTRKFIKTEKKKFVNSLKNCNFIRFFDSQTYFVLAELKNKIKSDKICRYLADRKILIRDCTNFQGLSDNFIRFSLKTEKENKQLAHSLMEFNDIV